MWRISDAGCHDRRASLEEEAGHLEECEVCTNGHLENLIFQRHVGRMFCEALISCG